MKRTKEKYGSIDKESNIQEIGNPNNKLTAFYQLTNTIFLHSCSEYGTKIWSLIFLSLCINGASLSERLEITVGQKLMPQAGNERRKWGCRDKVVGRYGRRATPVDRTLRSVGEHNEDKAS